jgi:hypothetical protein
MKRFVRHGSPVALAALLLTTLAGCSGHPSGAARPSPTSTGNAQILAIGREAAQCMREHGIADFPDPIVDQDGHLGLPPGPTGERAKQELNSNPAAQQACEPILDRLPPAARVDNGGAPSQQDMANLLKFAKCMRENGIPEWPDPRPDGTFPLSGTPLQTEGKSARLRAGMQACKQFWDRGIRGS